MTFSRSDEKFNTLDKINKLKTFGRNYMFIRQMEDY